VADTFWPAIPSGAWKETYATLHLWTQVVGKVALAQAPPVNHSWAVALQVTARGLTTRPLPHGHRSFTIEFDFLDHLLAIKTSDGSARTLPLSSRSVASFYREVMGLLQAMALPVRIWPVSVEAPETIRLDSETSIGSYDPEYANKVWRIVVNSERVLNSARAQFIGKCSPVHFFWGGFDLACSRFSGRPAPPREGPAFMREAYSHEVISHGFWPGGSWPGADQLLEPLFYAYAVPEPAGLKQAPVRPAEAYYHEQMGEFVLPYEAVRTSADPDAALRAFIDSTYDQAATLAKWDRASLERAHA